MYVFYDHNEERQLDSQSLFFVGRTSDVSRGYIGSHDLQNRGLDVLIGQSFYVSVMNWELWQIVLDLSQIWSGFEPMLYRIDRKPDWYVFWNIGLILKLININY